MDLYLQAQAKIPKKKILAGQETGVYQGCARSFDEQARFGFDGASYHHYHLRDATCCSSFVFVANARSCRSPSLCSSSLYLSAAIYHSLCQARKH